MCKYVDDIVYGLRLSTVVPGRLTEENTNYDLQNIDLAMKLHYLNCLYLFAPDGSSESSRFTAPQLKLPMFPLLTASCHVSGRIRGRHDHQDEQRPYYIKCNDCGIRIVEAWSDLTVAEVAQLNNDHQSVYDKLIYKCELGPDLGFSPLVSFQFTQFKCGGFSIGLRWAHVLGDAFSASAFFNTWARLFSNDPTASVHLTGGSVGKTSQVPLSTSQLRFAKRVDPVADHWVVKPGRVNMKIVSFRVGGKQVSQLRSNLCGYGGAELFPPFEILSALLWKSIARIRATASSEPPSVVTVCHRNQDYKPDHQVLLNSQLISTVEAITSPLDAEVSDLVMLLAGANKAADEKRLIEEAIEKENGKGDFVVYGANLTFLDLGEVGLYGAVLKGKKPIMAMCTVDGVGEGGLVVVGPDDDEEEDGRIVSVTLAEGELAELKSELHKEWGIAY